MKRNLYIIALLSVLTMLLPSCNTEEPVKVENISVSPSELNLAIGEKMLLTAYITPDNAKNKTVIWTSTDDGIASVDENGLVTALAAGDAKITVTVADGEMVAECNIIVTENPIEKITLDKNEAEMFIGETLTLTAITAPSLTDVGLKWTSSDKTVATVSDEGVVSGVEYGTCAIFVTTDDGSVSASCMVKVKDHTLDFPDPNFKAELVRVFDANGDGEINQKEAETVVSLNCRKMKITTLEGLQYLTNLEGLDFSNNDVESVDFSNNKNLKIIIGSNNTLLKTLNISSCTNLEKLIVSNASIESIDITSCTALNQLILSNNKLSSLDLSNNSRIVYLWIQNNNLKDIDVSSVKSLKDFKCDSTGITSIDFSKNKQLQYFSAENCRLTEVDFSANTALITATVSHNEISSLDFSANPSVKKIYCEDNLITDLNVSRSASLEVLSCSKNKLTALDLSGTFALKSLTCGNNMLETLDVSRCSNDMTTLDCAPMPTLKTITVSSYQTSISSLYPKRDNTKIPEQAEIITK